MIDTGPALLVVDDDENNRYTLTRRLRQQGYNNVVTAENGRRALDLLATRHFDLVLLDIMMPEMDGYEVLESIKADPKLRQIPTVVITALDEIDSVVRCIELGAEDYLTKPFNPTLLRARVGACLEKKRLRDQETAYLEQMEKEKKRADDLLHAFLPAGAVQELKATGAVRPRRFEEVAVLFCDIVGFTEYCDRHPPEQVVAELQTLIERLEVIATEHEMVKIKTIGDAFLSTAGLLQPVADPVLKTARCGLAMAAAAGETEPGWQVRVGLHFGPVVAGVVGSRQYLYDLWGDTVNTAARLAEHADPGRVIMTTATWLQVRNRCRSRTLGLVEIKGKGKVELVECLEMV